MSTDIFVLFFFVCIGTVIALGILAVTFLTILSGWFALVRLFGFLP